jgi:formylglycine-generating enzyme required for sulfatase activity
MKRMTSAVVLLLFPLSLWGQAQIKQAGVCGRCHVVSVLEWSISRHSKGGTNCQACHGPSQGHVTNERNEIKPDRVPHGAAIADLCQDCHSSGCPKTAQTAACETCHHVHALVNPKQAQVGEDPELAKLYTRWDQFQSKMQAGEHLLELRNWAAAREDFQAALGLVPGNAQATTKLELCERRLHPTLPGFEIEGNQYDSGTGLPKEVKVAGLGIPMVLVPGGEVDIGSDDLTGAQPVNTVRVEAFYLGKYELTQAQWKALMGTNPSVHQGDNLPVERVSWLDCQALVQKLNERIPGRGFRLPTEAEWEYGARAGSNPPLSAAELVRFAWFREDSVVASGALPAFLQVDAFATRPVGTKQPNNWSFYDTYGNVWEWCSSLLKPYPYDPADGRESDSEQGLRVLRGGSFADTADLLNPALRHGEQAGRRYRWNGLRLARSVPHLAKD